MQQLPDFPFYDVSGPIPISHRGGDAAGSEKENSLMAFQSAAAAGLHYIETDVVASIDGVAHAVHGAHHRLEQRHTGLPIRAWLESLSADYIRQYVRIGGEPIPTLEEVLLEFPDIHFFIDPKTWHSVEPLANIVCKHKLYNRVSIGAFHFGRTRAVIELIGSEKRVCTTIGTVASLALLSNRVPLSVLSRYIKHSGATQFALPYDRVTASTVAKAHALRMRVMLWTPNDPREITYAFKTGADGVMSDRTYLLLAIANSFTAKSKYRVS